MVLEFMIWRMVSHAAAFSQFSRLLTEFTLAFWLPWIRQHPEVVAYVLVDGPDELGYQLVPASAVQKAVDQKPLLTLSEYRKLLQLRDAWEGAEGEEAVSSGSVLNWIN